MTLTDADIPKGIFDLYPYNFEANIRLILSEDSGFLYSLIVKNAGDDPLPISPGLHPYWAVDHPYKPSIRTEGIAGFNASSIEWDSNPPDNRYSYNGKVTLYLPDKTITIEDITEGDPVIKKMVVWSQKPAMSDFDFVCFEPVCGDDMAFYDDPIIIQPDQEWHMQLRFTVTV